MDKTVHFEKVTPKPNGSGSDRQQVPTTISLTDRVIAFVDARLPKNEAWKTRKAG
jgi:hypothetical protein